jgi:hypothetical protein
MEMSPWSIDQVNSKVLGTISCGGSMWLRRHDLDLSQCASI